MTHDVHLWNQSTKQRTWPKRDEDGAAPAQHYDPLFAFSKPGLRYFSLFIPIYQKLPECVAKDHSQTNVMDMAWLNRRYDEYQALDFPRFISNGECDYLLIEAVADAVAAAIRSKTSWLIDADLENCRYDGKTPAQLELAVRGAQGSATDEEMSNLAEIFLGAEHEKYSDRTFLLAGLMRWLSGFAADLETRVDIFAKVCDSTKYAIDNALAIAARYLDVADSWRSQGDFRQHVESDHSYRELRAWSESGILFDGQSTRLIMKTAE